MQNRFFVGDEQGHLKSLRVSSSEHDLKMLHTFPSAIQNISTTRSSHVRFSYTSEHLNALSELHCKERLLHVTQMDLYLRIK